jgi:hypothetical protein
MTVTPSFSSDFQNGSGILLGILLGVLLGDMRGDMRDKKPGTVPEFFPFHLLAADEGRLD